MSDHDLRRILETVDKINNSKGYTTGNFKTEKMLESDPLRKMIFLIKSERSLNTLDRLKEEVEKRIEVVKKQKEGLEKHD